MDTSDPSISFDESGVCSNCRKAEGLLAKVTFSEKESRENLRKISERIRGNRTNSQYDCIIGLSGGVDSSYAAHITNKIGLKALAVHFDNGWNSKIAVSNIKKIVAHCDWDLMTYVIDWEEFRDLQRAFIKASVVDIEMVTDHAIVAAMVGIAKENNIHYVISGSNVATEHCMPRAWLWNKQDLVNIKAIQKRFGEKKLKSFPMLSSWRWLFLRRTAYENVKILNSTNYKKFGAIRTLKEQFDWCEYGHKHFESLFTKFYQAYILPEKFGIDKRKAHLSSLIRNGEISREAALETLQEPLYDPDELRHDKEYVLKKLGFSEEEFDSIMKIKSVPHDHYPSDRNAISILMSIYFVFKKLGIFRGRRL
jgi:N-acetyl sugar amidotransferase